MPQPVNLSIKGRLCDERNFGKVWNLGGRDDADDVGRGRAQGGRQWRSGVLKKALGRHMENKEALPMVSVATAS